MVRLLIGLFIVTSVSATTFRTQPIEQQIQESDGVFIGNYLKSKTVQLENGSLATQHIFKITQENGLQSDYFGMDEVIVHYPGGELNGRYVKVDGVPSFNAGEKVLLFIRTLNNRYWGMNLGFGSFKVINYGKDVILVNYIYPHDSKVGQVHMSYFENALKKIKGSRLKTVEFSQYPVLNQVAERAPASIVEDKGQNRSVASKPDQLENEEDGTGEVPNNLSIFWLMAVLGILGGLFRLVHQKSSK